MFEYFYVLAICRRGRLKRLWMGLLEQYNLIQTMEKLGTISLACKYLMYYGFLSIFSSPFFGLLMVSLQSSFCRHMIKKKSKESFIAFKEALKHKYVNYFCFIPHPRAISFLISLEQVYTNRVKIACRRNSWQLWENFSEVAMDVGNISQVLSTSFLFGK